jgi:hypothetical protein
MRAEHLAALEDCARQAVVLGMRRWEVQVVRSWDIPRHPEYKINDWMKDEFRQPSKGCIHALYEKAGRMRQRSASGPYR